MRTSTYPPPHHTVSHFQTSSDEFFNFFLIFDVTVNLGYRAVDLLRYKIRYIHITIS